jgi:hypothetical protein
MFKTLLNISHLERVGKCEASHSTTHNDHTKSICVLHFARFPHFLHAFDSRLYFHSCC